MTKNSETRVEQNNRQVRVVSWNDTLVKPNNFDSQSAASCPDVLYVHPAFSYRRSPLVIVTGPEGSGTTYVWRSIMAANPRMRGSVVWNDEIFDGTQIVPEQGVHHVSLPSRRPCRWLSEVQLPSHAKIVAIVRKKQFAVRSAFRRFGKGSEELELRNYDLALNEIERIGLHFPVIKLHYEKLGEPAIRKSISNFVGLETRWAPFINRND